MIPGAFMKKLGLAIMSAKEDGRPPYSRLVCGLLFLVQVF
jgi:hypothetical protein